jgi:hypothetical protein
MSNASRSTSASSQTWAYRTKLKSALGEEFKEYEDSRPREDKIIHNKVAKPRRENISQQGHKDSPFELLKSVFVAFAILL